MAHPQSSPRGLIAKQRIDTGSSQQTYDSTGLILNGGIKVSDARYITADSTGYVLTAESAIPSAIEGSNKFTMVANSTGHAMALNTTDTAWKYIQTTSVQPT